MTGQFGINRGSFVLLQGCNGRRTIRRLLAILIPFCRGMVTGQVCGPKNKVTLSLVIVARWPLEANFVMENRRLLRPGTCMQPCNSVTKGCPWSSTLEIFTFPVVEHQIMWPLATSTPKFGPSIASYKSACFGVICWVALLSGR